MNEPSKIPAAFAASGDKNTIPATTTTPGAASWSVGFPAITSVPVSQGGVAPTRADFNGILNALSLGLMWLQQGNHYSYSADLDYNPGALVADDGALYFCKQANGPTTEVVAPGTDASVWGLLLNAEGNSTINTSGHAGNATKATQDGAGNVITSTYLTINGAADEYLTQSDASDTYLSRTDAATTYATKEEDAEKLPLSGGTMTGTIMLSNNGSIRMSGATGFTGLYSASSYVDGAYVSLNSKGYPSEGHNQAGAFFIYARNGDAVKGLVGKTDGSLQWDGKTIECATQKGTGYLKLSDGTQICYGTKVLNTTTGTTVTFPRAFKSAPNVSAHPTGSTTFNLDVAIGSRSATGFFAIGYNNSGTAVSWVTCDFIAVGEGAD